MVAQKRTHRFRGKVNEFFEDKMTPERQRSGVVHFTFRYRSDVVQETVQVGSTELNLRTLRNTF